MVSLPRQSFEAGLKHGVGSLLLTKKQDSTLVKHEVEGLLLRAARHELEFPLLIKQGLKRPAAMQIRLMVVQTQSAASCVLHAVRFVRLNLHWTVHRTARDSCSP